MAAICIRCYVIPCENLSPSNLRSIDNNLRENGIETLPQSHIILRAHGNTQTIGIKNYDIDTKDPDT